MICAGRVNRGLPLLNVADDALFVHHEGCASGKALLFAQNAVRFGNLSFEIAQQREGDLNVFSKSLVGGKTVNADTENLRLFGFELGNISLICLEFARSAAGESQHIKGEHDTLLAFEIAQLHGLAVLIYEGEVGSRIADFQMRLGRLLRAAGRGKRGEQQQQCKPGDDRFSISHD